MMFHSELNQIPYCALKNILKLIDKNVRVKFLISNIKHMFANIYSKMSTFVFFFEKRILKPMLIYEIDLF